MELDFELMFRAIEVYTKAVETLVELASLQVPHQLLRINIVLDRIRNLGRSHQSHESSRQRIGTCPNSSNGEYYQVYQQRA